MKEKTTDGVHDGALPEEVLDELLTETLDCMRNVCEKHGVSGGTAQSSAATLVCARILVASALMFEGKELETAKRMGSLITEAVERNVSDRDNPAATDTPGENDGKETNEDTAG